MFMSAASSFSEISSTMFVTTYFGALAQDPIVFVVLIAVALWQSRHVRFGGSVRA